MNITELARKLKTTPEDLKKELPRLGLHIGKKAIQIPDEQAEKVKKAWRKRQKQLAAIRKLRKNQQKKELTPDKKDKKDKKIQIPSSIQVYALAEKLDIPVTKLIGELMKNGVSASINESLDFEVAAIVSESLGFDIEKGEEGETIKRDHIKKRLKSVLSAEDKKNLKSRPPVVTVLGHVDHGKSSILDAIRETKIVEGEKGGITQHIGAYQIKHQDKLITFIDTPGHKAFQSMRSTGGEVADIVVLVIAADDKIQPQTLESIKIIQEENIPFVVAINKIDKPESDIEKIKKQLSEVNLMPEGWGGEVICVPVSAKTKKGLKDLLDTINLVAEVEEDNLLSNPKGEPVGIVIESHKDEGLGPVASLVLYNGTLKKGDRIILGESIGKIRSLISFTGKRLEKVLPSMPAEIIGLNSVPRVGSSLKVFEEKENFKKEIRKIEKNNYKKGAEFKETDVSRMNQKTDSKSLNLILKADVRGSLEALVSSLKALTLPEVNVGIVKKGLGNITETDVELASSVQAKILGFGVDVNSAAKKLARDKDIIIKTDGVIYRLINYVQDELEKLAPEEIIEVPLGVLEVLKIFKNNTNSMIVGCRVKDGKAEDNALVRVWDKDKFVSLEKQKEGDIKGLKGEGKIQELQTHKQNTNEVKAGKECGINLVGVEAKEGDLLELYKEKKVKK